MGDTELATRGYVKGRIKSLAPLFGLSSLRPTLGATDSGRSFIESDTGNALWWTGAVWKYFGNRAVVSSTTRPTGSLAYEGLEIYETDTDKTYIQINGSWVQNVLSTGPAELGFSKTTSNSTAVTSLTASDITGLATTVTVGARPIIIEASVALYTPNGLVQNKVLLIREGSTVLGQSVMHAYALGTPAGLHTAVAIARLTPSAGSHTYKLSVYTVEGNQVIPTAALDTPNFIWVREV